MVHIERPRMRPRFEVAIEPSPDAVVRALKDRVATHEICSGQFYRSEVRLGIRPSHATVWSPHLHARFDDSEDGSIVLRGQFLPHPNVWTTFMAIYGVISMLALFGTMYGFAQVGLGQSPWALWSLPIGLAAIAFVYGASLIGQGLSAEQMYTLRTVLDDAVEDAQTGPETETAY